MKAHKYLLLIGALALSAAPALSACGDDSKPKKKDTTKKKAAKKKKKRGGGGGKSSDTLQTYTKVEDRVDAEEAEKLRHEFKGGDFIPDVTGAENRDPFRSYVVAQVGINSDEAVQVQPTDICGKDNMVATNYSLRDLRLVGIVLRGTRSYALFRDTASFGHIVRRGDCLGKEKARVASIGSGFVSLEVIPEVAPNQPARPPQERSIQLYPEELQLSDPTAPGNERIEDDQSGDAEE